MRAYAMLVMLVLTVGASSAAAQTGPSFGIKAGVNLAKLNVSGESADVSFDRRVGVVAGAFVLVPASKTFGVQIEGLYSQKGARFEEEGFNPFTGERTVFKLATEIDSLDVPVLVRYSIPSSRSTSFHLFAGPSFGLRLSANAIGGSDGDEEKADISDDIARLDVGVVGGAGVEFGKFIIDGRYTYGFTNLIPDAGTVKSRVISIMAGFRF